MQRNEDGESPTAVTRTAAQPDVQATQPAVRRAARRGSKAAGAGSCTATMKTRRMGKLNEARIYHRTPSVLGAEIFCFG